MSSSHSHGDAQSTFADAQSNPITLPSAARSSTSITFSAREPDTSSGHRISIAEDGPSSNLRETASFYRKSLDVPDDSSLHRYRTSSLQRNMSMSSQGSRRNVRHAQGSSGRTDDGAADDAEDSFVQPRSQPSSILPHSSFFAPKKPSNRPPSSLSNNMSPSASSPVSPMRSGKPQGPIPVSYWTRNDPLNAQDARYSPQSYPRHLRGSSADAQMAPSSDPMGPTVWRGDPEPLDYDGNPGLVPARRSADVSAIGRPVSPWGLASRRGSGETTLTSEAWQAQVASGTGPGAGSNDGHGVGKVPAAYVAAYKGTGLQSQASREPLLPEGRRTPQWTGSAAEGKSLPSPVAEGSRAVDIEASQRLDTYASQSFTARSRCSLKVGTSSSSPGDRASAHFPPRPQTAFAPHPPSSSRASKPHRKRNFARHGGANRFFLGGWIMTSSDNPLPFLASLVLMMALAGLWFGFVASYIWHHLSPAAVILFGYTFAVAFVNMLVTAWRDPGVLPRDLDPDPPVSTGTAAPLDPEDPLAVPLPRIIQVRETDLKVKWCETCGTYRAPRSSHCRLCDNCVENIDHHCTFLNTCIGRRNYFSFFAFLVFAIITGGLCIAFSILHLYYLTRSTDYSLPGGGFGGGHDFRGALSTAPVSAVLVVITTLSIAPLFTLLSYHIRLVAMNRTTVEQIRINTTRDYGEKSSDAGYAEKRCCTLGISGRDPNPFAYRNPWHNMLAALCRPVPDSWIDRRAFVEVDGRLDNPGWAAEKEVVGADAGAGGGAPEEEGRAVPMSHGLSPPPALHTLQGGEKDAV